MSPTKEAPRLLLATNNAGKIGELRALLEGCGWEILAPADIGLSLAVEETGLSYAENARIKARAFASAGRIAALADDSGLEVDALAGEPGALHHLHGWDGSDHDERIRVLLDHLKAATPADRTCRYRAVVLVVFPDGSEIEGEGTCEGIIVDQPCGDGGFGYDPVFFLPGLGRTMAELTFEEKNSVSHRARAVAEVAEQLSKFARASNR